MTRRSAWLLGLAATTLLLTALAGSHGFILGTDSPPAGGASRLASPAAGPAAATETAVFALG